jgi:hypothetical protein
MLPPAVTLTWWFCTPLLQRAGCLIAENPSMERAGRMVVQSSTFDSSTAAVLGGAIVAEILTVRGCNFSNSESFSVRGDRCVGEVRACSLNEPLK